ncbi:MAG: nucleotidyltransferase family protein [Gemmatimonadota bacterium]
MTRSPDADAHLWPSPSQRLLLCAALGEPAAAVDAFANWRASIDPNAAFGWDALCLLPLAYDNLRRLGVHDEPMERMKGVYRKTFVETNRLFHETRPVLEQLANEGIELLLLKGAPLSFSYYGNLALRPMSDVDFVVRTTQVADAVRVLEAHGWRGDYVADDVSLRFRHAIRFTRDDGRELDLHWRVLIESRDDASTDFFWQHTVPCSFLGIHARQLDPTALIVHTVLHGVRWNTVTPVRWIPDALLVLRTRGSEVDWNAVLAFATRRKVTFRLGLGLSFLAKEFDAPIPADVIRAVTQRGPTVAERLENMTLLVDPVRFLGPVGNTLWIALDYSRGPGYGGVIAYLAEFPNYLAFRWYLSNRREVLPYVFRRLVRRLTRRA